MQLGKIKTIINYCIYTELIFNIVYLTITRCYVDVYKNVITLRNTLYIHDQKWVEPTFLYRCIVMENI